MRRLVLTTCLLSVSLVTACSGQPAALPYSPKFQLAQFDVPAAIAVKPAGEQKPEVKGTETLVVNISQFLSRFRRVLAVPAGVNKVLITVTAADGTVFTQILDLAALNAGQTSVTFNGLVPGEATIRVEAYDASNKVIGSSTDKASIVPGVLAQKDMTLSMGHTQQRLGGSGGGAAATNGSIGVEVTLADVAAVHSFIRTPGANLAIADLAGGTQGHADGPAASAAFQYGGAMARGPNGDLFIFDQGNYVLRKISTTGWVSTLAGMVGQPGYRDGAGAQAIFDRVDDIAVDAAGRVYLSEPNNDAVRMVDTTQPVGSPSYVVTLAGGTSGAADGSAADAQFTVPGSVALDGLGKVYIAEDKKIRVIDTSKSPTASDFVTTFAGTGDGSTFDGPEATARFEMIRQLTLGPDGKLYVLDDNRIRRVDPTLPKTDPGFISTLWDGQQNVYRDGTGVDASLAYAIDMGLDAQGRIYVVDVGGLRLIDTTRPATDAHYVTTLAGGSLISGSPDPELPWRFRIAVAPNGSVYMWLEEQYRLVKVTPW